MIRGVIRASPRPRAATIHRLPPGVDPEVPSPARLYDY